MTNKKSYTRKYFPRLRSFLSLGDLPFSFSATRVAGDV
jgi:hypothetical protein